MAIQKIQVGMVLSIAMVGIIVSALAAGLFSGYQRIPSNGNVKGVRVGVYWDSAGTSNVTSINWGFVEPGKTVNVTVYIKNIGTIPLVLNVTTDSWNPISALNYMRLIWNRESYVLSVGSVVQAVLTLSVSSNISGIASFSFNIIVTGTEKA